MTEYVWRHWDTFSWRLFAGSGGASFGQLRRDGAGEYWLTPHMGGVINYSAWPAIKLEGITTLEDAQAAGLVLLSLKQTEVGND